MLSQRFTSFFLFGHLRRPRFGLVSRKRPKSARELEKSRDFHCAKRGFNFVFRITRQRSIYNPRAAQSCVKSYGRMKSVFSTVICPKIGVNPSGRFLRFTRSESQYDVRMYVRVCMYVYDSTEIKKKDFYWML